MHNATTKQRHAALRRKLGIFLGGAPRWVRERRRRALALKERIEAALSFAVTPPQAFATREHAVEAPASAPPRGALAPRTAPTEPALPAFVPPPPPAGRAAPPSVPAAGRAADAPTVIERLSPREPSRPTDHGRDGPPRTTRVLVGAAASCAAVLAVAFLAELRDARRSGALAPPASGASERAARSAPAPSPALPPAPAAPAPASRAQLAAGAVAVVRGDTLWHLAARHLGDPRRWPGLFEANRGAVRDPDLIYPGQELRLPAR